MFCRHLNHETDGRHADHIVEKGAQVFVNHCNAGTVGHQPNQLLVSTLLSPPAGGLTPSPLWSPYPG